jgi:hypothetical protein
LMAYLGTAKSSRFRAVKRGLTLMFVNKRHILPARMAFHAAQIVGAKMDFVIKQCKSERDTS